MKCWNDYWTYTKTAEFKAEMKQIVMAPDFLDNNYLSNEVRVPVTLLETFEPTTGENPFDLRQDIPRKGVVFTQRVELCPLR